MCWEIRRTGWGWGLRELGEFADADADGSAEAEGGGGKRGQKGGEMNFVLFLHPVHLLFGQRTQL